MANKQAELLNDRGLISLENGEYDKALDDFNEAIKLDTVKEYPACYVNRGNVFLKKEEFQKALDDFNAAIELTPNDSKALAGRARAYLGLKEYDKGLDDVNMARKIEPFNAEFKDINGELFSKMGAEMSSKPFVFTAPKAKSLYYKNKLSEFTFEGEVKKIIYEKLEELERLERDGEYTHRQSLENWFEWIIKLPWKDTPSRENYTLSDVKKILEEGHYGLWDVKNRVLEFLAVRKMRQNTKGAVLCFVGPPGTGKTSIGKAIANALGRPFYRFSVGGINDAASIRGQRQGYIGSEPGRIITGLRAKESKALVMLIDEVDKIAVGGGVNGGDPAGALLEVLDPEQNDSFRDNYIDIPFDLSNILFILTANDLKNMKPEFLDRLEIIEFSEYIQEEKFQIAQKFLKPKNLEKNGLEKEQVSYTNDAILHIIDSYDYEPGVRLLEQNFDKIHRKLIRQIIEQQEAGEGEVKKSFVIDKEQIENYLGKPLEPEIKKQKADRPGMAVGLVVMGNTWGMPSMIETISIPGEEGYTITGNMITDKDTSTSLMKESVETAFSYARKYAIEHNYCDRSWFKENYIHIHFPGSSPKDGNSAGITIATALLSLFKNQVVTDKYVMTGEITLTGQVLAIGGLKQKVIGAINNDAKHIIFPKQNMRDFEEIPNHVKEKIEIHPVERFEEVLALMLP
jgi:ATP-dependent Lon protease